MAQPQFTLNQSPIQDDSKYLIVRHLSFKDLVRVFWKIDVNKETGCWEWNAHLSEKGYGRFSWANRGEAAHRVLYAWLVEPLLRRPWKVKCKHVPQLDHLCKNPRCVYPGHLELVSPRVNSLRSESPMAQNARKTHCPKGHKLPDSPNTCLDSKPQRQCRECQRQFMRTEHRKAYMRRYMKTWRYTAPNFEERMRKHRDRNREAYHAKKRLLKETLEIALPLDPAIPEHDSPPATLRCI